MPYPTKERQPEHRWTVEEDEILLAAIGRCGHNIIWSQISACLPGRNNKSCRKRWIHSLDPSLRKGRWTEGEDSMLINAIETYGNQWFQVAKLLPGRTDDQCAKRWRENLDPKICRTPWTKEEDDILMDTYEKLGKCWKDISDCFQGRPPVHCRNRVQSLIRARRRAEKTRLVGKNKHKCKPPQYDDELAADSPKCSDSSDSWEIFERQLEDYAMDTFESDTVSSAASSEQSIYPTTPSSQNPESDVGILSYEAPDRSAPGYLTDNETMFESLRQHFFYDNSAQSSSSSSCSSSYGPSQLTQMPGRVNQLGTSSKPFVSSSDPEPKYEEYYGPLWGSYQTGTRMSLSNTPSIGYSYPFIDTSAHNSYDCNSVSHDQHQPYQHQHDQYHSRQEAATIYGNHYQVDLQPERHMLRQYAPFSLGSTF